MKDTFMTGFYFFKKLYITHDMAKSAKILFFFTIETYNGSSFHFLNLKRCKKKGKFTKIVFGKGEFCG